MGRAQTVAPLPRPRDWCASLKRGPVHCRQARGARPSVACCVGGAEANAPSGPHRPPDSRSARRERKRDSCQPQNLYHTPRSIWSGGPKLPRLWGMACFGTCGLPDTVFILASCLRLWSFRLETSQDTIFRSEVKACRTFWSNSSPVSFASRLAQRAARRLNSIFGTSRRHASDLLRPLARSLGANSRASGMMSANIRTHSRRGSEAPTCVSSTRPRVLYWHTGWRENPGLPWPSPSRDTMGGLPTPPRAPIVPARLSENGFPRTRRRSPNAWRTCPMACATVPSRNCLSSAGLLTNRTVLPWIGPDTGWRCGRGFCSPAWSTPTAWMQRPFRRRRKSIYVQDRQPSRT